MIKTTNVLLTTLTLLALAVLWALASMSVAGNRCMISTATGLWVRIDTPRSPVSTPLNQVQNCSYSGRSRPKT